MKRLSTKVNYVLNFIRIISATLVGLIMMPYVNRVLGVNNIGKVEYAYTIINYFLMFSAVGIPIYGIREIAKTRNDIVERTKLTLELLIILSVTTIIAYVSLFILIFPLNFFSDYKSFIIILSSMILLTNIGADWYFQGMENQVYITIRYAFVRVLTITLLFLFVKSEANVFMYCFLLVLNFAGSNIFNLLFIFKSINLKTIRFSDLDIKRHLLPILKIFIAAISINIYAQLDNFIIGFLAGDKYLAYYAVPNKLIRYVISFITVVGIVLLPKISRLWQTNKVEYYKNLKLAFEIIFLLSVPFMGYFLIFSPFIIHIMAGQDFYESIITMRILSPLCVIVGLAYFYGYLLLYTQKRESIYTISVLISALLSVLMNMIMVKYFQQNGAAITQVIVELLAISFMAYKTRNQIPELKLSLKEISKVIFASFFACFSSLLISKLFKENFIEFGILSIIYFFQIFVILIICKEKNVLDILGKMKIGLKKI